MEFVNLGKLLISGSSPIQALAMVEEECRRYKPTKNYLEHLGSIDTPPFETALMRSELDMKRYELPPPPPGKLSDVGAWNESVTNSMAQLEHQSVRAISKSYPVRGLIYIGLNSSPLSDLELMMDYGCEAWKSNLEVLTALQAKAQTQLQELRKEIQEVNWQRKSKQMQAGERLRALEAHWVLLVSKNYDIEQACAQLDEDIFLLKSQMRTAVAVEEDSSDSSEEEQEDKKEQSPEQGREEEGKLESPEKEKAASSSSEESD